MADQIIYDNNGAFQCVRRFNPDGSTTSFGPGTNLWDDYVAKNGAPPPTGTPTYPPAALPANIQNAITAFKQFKSASSTQQQNLTGAQLGGLINSIIDCLNYLNNQIKNS